MSEKGVAIYSRVARADDYALANQERIIRSFAHDNGYTVCHRYSDNGLHGLTLNRPGLEILMADIRSKAIGTVIIKDLTRIARGIPLLCEWMDFTKKHEVKVISVQDGDLADSFYLPHSLTELFKAK